MRRTLIGFLLITLTLPLLGASCTQQIDQETRDLMKPRTLTYWRVFDGPDTFAPLIERYQAMHPNIKIEYRKLRYEEYRDELLEAFATDRGPDIFSIHNTWVREYQSRGFLEAMPPSTTMVFPRREGTIKKEVVYQKETAKTITPAKLKEAFVDTVYHDVVIPELDATGNAVEKIYGLPLALDTLTLFYNRDLYNNAGITAPPAYWNREFQQDVKKLTKQNNRGEIIQSGAGLGGSENVERSTDILSVLMMQNGTVMMQNGAVKFHLQPSAMADSKYHPGLDALRFYSDFANPAKEVYSWNKTLPNSLDLFTQNKLAMFFGYSYMLPDIKARAPKLNFALAPLPQIEGNLATVNYANYWVEAVAKKSKHKNEAWDFLQYIAKKDQAKLYIAAVRRPPALRSLIDEFKEDEEIGVFVDQALTAKSWYEGMDALSAEIIMKEMIDGAVLGQQESGEIISAAAKKVQQTVKEKE